MGAVAGIPDGIQQFMPGGFQIGESGYVNAPDDTYYWTAFKDSRMLDLAVSKNVDNPAPNEGELVSFRLTARNLGPDDATGVQVTDNLPAGVTFQSATPSQGAYDDGSGVWDVGGGVNAGGATLSGSMATTPTSCSRTSSR